MRGNAVRRHYGAGLGDCPRLTAYAVLGVLCCLLRKNGIYAVVPMLLASALHRE